MVSESRVTWATSVPILVFLFFSLPVLDLGPMYATHMQTDVRHHHRLTTIRHRFDCDSIIVRLPFDGTSTALRLFDNLWL